jgi:glycosyltransferase involved in cell wall biosynthesis
MKVAHLITGKVFAGIEQHVFELATAMDSQTDHVILCDKSLVDYMSGVPTHSTTMGSRISPINIIKLVLFVWKNNVDILHCHGAKASAIGGWVGLITRLKIVATIHGLKSQNRSIKYADSVIGVNKEVVKDIPQAKVIPNWFNPAHQGLPSSRTGPVVAVGRLEKVKGFDLLINAWVNIKEELNIIGSGKELLPLQELIAKLGLADRIKILTDHSYESIEDIYKNASGLIVSSLREGGPRTVLEAINHNIPVLGTNVGIMPQIIPRDLLAKAGDQVSLTALLEEMIPLLPQLDVSAIKVAMHENYSLENACVQTKEVYFSL